MTGPWSWWRLCWGSWRSSLFPSTSRCAATRGANTDVIRIVLDWRTSQVNRIRRVRTVEGATPQDTAAATLRVAAAACFYSLVAGASVESGGKLRLFTLDELG